MNDIDPDVTITASELQVALAGDAPPALLDVRWQLGVPDGRPDFRAGHVPDAVYVDLDSELAAPASSQGRHPLPTIEQLQSAARGWGVRAGQAVVVYDASGGLAAGRAWWLLRWAGVADVRLLDGGLAAWKEVDARLATGDVEVVPGDVELSPGHLPVLTADDAAALPAAGVLLDARAPERYRGEVEPIDPQAGHIPGARSAPTGENLDAEGRFLPADELRRRFDELGATPDVPVGVYCGSGVTAAHQIVALARAGIPAALYSGSWSAWSADPTRPVATGSEP